MGNGNHPGGESGGFGGFSGPNLFSKERLEKLQSIMKTSKPVLTTPNNVTVDEMEKSNSSGSDEIEEGEEEDEVNQTATPEF